MAMNHTKTCPDCGASNSAADLFCLECGASLAAVGMVAEQTNAFTPVAPAADTQTTSVAPAVAPQPEQAYSYPVADQATSYGYTSQQESGRGAALGWLAATLFLVIVGFFLWSSVFSDATRDRFTGWF